MIGFIYQYAKMNYRDIEKIIDLLRPITDSLVSAGQNAKNAKEIDQKMPLLKAGFSCIKAQNELLQALQELDKYIQVYFSDFNTELENLDRRLTEFEKKAEQAKRRKDY